MSIRLRQLIRQVRACKTAAEERAIIATECALIRTSFKEGNESNRSRNVAKLLYMHMLGYPSHFGQMECIKLIASPSFPDKRVGYLGLMLLLQEKDEVLMLGTNSLKSDLSHPLPQVVGLALCAVGNLATPDMSRDLAMEVDKHLQPGGSSNLRKKAALCTVRVLRKCPELVEDFVDRVLTLLVERSHGVVLCGVQLLIAILEIDPEQALGLAKVIPSLVKLMRNLLSTGFSSEYDVAGVTDPFLQVRVLRLLRLLGQRSPDESDEINSLLSQVATTTETAKNAGNSILYECVQTIMKLESESSLRSMAINILGRFLLHRDNNMRYVALTTLGRVVSHDLASVQRHRGTIVDCLKDPDPSIRLRAIDLIFQLVSRNSARAMVAELLNYLVVAPTDQKRDLCSKILQVVEDHAPSARWRVGTLLSMLGIAGAECHRSVPSAAVVYVTQNDELHANATHKTFRMLQADTSQLGLTLAAVWFTGEYGDLLLRPCSALSREEGVEGEEGVDGSTADWGNVKSKSDDPPEKDEGSPKARKALALIGSGLGEAYPAVSGANVVELMAKVMKDHSSDRTTKGYVLTALTKLAGRLGEEHEDAIESLLQTYSGSMNLELQARSCEYSQLLRPDYSDLRRGMLDRMPVADEETVRNRRARFRVEDKEDDDYGGRVTVDHLEDFDEDEGRGLPSFRISKARQQRRGSGGDGSLGSGGISRGSKKVFPLAGPTPPPASVVGGEPAASAGAEQQHQQPVGNLLDLDDLFGGGGSSATGGSGGDQGSGVLSSGVSASAGSALGTGGVSGAGASTGAPTVDLMADIFSAPLAPAATAAKETVIDPFGLQSVAASGTGAASPVTGSAVAGASSAPEATGPGFGLGFELGLRGAGAGGGASAPGLASFGVDASGAGAQRMTLTAFDKDGLVVTFELSKPSLADPATTHIVATFGNTGNTDVRSLHFQAAVPKYLRLEMQPASGSVIPAGASSGVQQIVRITNSMQGQKNLLMKLKLSYERAGSKVQGMTSVNSFPAGY